ncbi:MAG TPA: glycosyltransferase [Thermoanaerobaculia bacterium]|nr:glycosyltransferase [Thermoanaerobaculia bacterium]
MKVTMVVSTLTAGGAERAVVNMANHWASVPGWRPTILTTSQRGRPIAYDLDPRVIVRDIGWPRMAEDGEMDRETVRAITGALDLDDPVNDTLLASIILLVLLRRSIVMTRPDAVISLIDVMNVRVLAATEGLPIRRFVSERCDPWRTSIGIFEPLRRRLYPRADGVIAQTAEAARYFGRFGGRCHAIPNVVVAPPPGERVRDSKKRLVALARLVAFKKLNLLIRAFAHIADRHPEWQLDIWGEGPQRPFLESVIEQVNGDGRIRLRGHARDVYEVLRGADLFAMTSTTEGFPNALCEAMACGVPAVVIDSGAGVRGIVRNGIDGMLVDAGGPEQFSVALDAIMSDDARRARLAARAPEIVERFSAARVMRQWEEVLSS